MFDRLTAVLEEIARELQNKKLSNANEAETRLKVIDRILFNGLGWSLYESGEEQPVENIRDLKQPLYLDYVLSYKGTPYLIVEAKRRAKTFALPSELNRREYSLKTLIQHCGENLREVIQQAHSYATSEGVPYAAVTNGTQWVIFRPYVAHQKWLNGTAVVFRDLSDLADNASRFYSSFGPTSFSSGEIDAILKLPRLPAPRFSKSFNDTRGADNGIEDNVLAKPFNTVFPLFFDSLTGKGDEQALRECYVALPPQKSYAREFSSLLQRSLPHFIPADTQPAIENQKPSGDLTSIIVEDKPSVIILVGNVGSGKSTFVHHLLRVYLPGVSATYWHIEDFIDDYQTLDANVDIKALETRVYSSLLGWIEESFPDINPYEYDNLKKIFARDIQRLATGARRKEFEKNSGAYIREEAELLNRLSTDPANLAISFMRYVREKLGKPLCVAFDNVDRGSEAFQQLVYAFAHRLSREAQCNVIVTMRYNVYETARLHGILDTRNDIVFQVNAPSLQSIFSKRIKFARRYLSNKAHRIKGLGGLEPGNVADFLDVINDLLLGERLEVRTCLESLSAGNIRLAFQHFKRFATSGHTDVDRLITTFNKARKRSVQAEFYFEDFFKPFVLGSYHRFHRSSSPLVNLFAVSSGQQDSHFIKLRLLSFLQLRYDRSPEGRERGETTVSEVISALAPCGHYEPAVLASITELVSKDLLERLTSSRKPLGRADIIRISAAGAYYIRVLVTNQMYLFFAAQDSVIYSEESFRKIYDAFKSAERDRAKSPQVVAAFIRYLEQEETGERARVGAVAVKPEWDREFAREMAIIILHDSPEDSVDRSRDLAGTAIGSKRRRSSANQLAIGSILDSNADQLNAASRRLTVLDAIAESLLVGGSRIVTNVLWSLYLAYFSGVGPIGLNDIVDYLSKFAKVSVDLGDVRRILAVEYAKYAHLILATGDGRFGLTGPGAQVAEQLFLAPGPVS